MDSDDLQKSVPRQPSLRNLTQVDYGKPKPQQNKVTACELNMCSANSIRSWVKCGDAGVATGRLRIKVK